MTRILAAVGLAIVVVGVVVLWIRAQGEEGAAVRSLPDVDRHALHTRTLETLETSCAPSRRPAGLDAFCTTQAKFILNFHECEAACQTLAEDMLAPRRSR